MIDIDVRAAGVDAMCCGSYKWLMAEFGVAPFYREPGNHRPRSIRPHRRIFGRARRSGLSLSAHSKTAQKFEGTSRAFGAVAQLQASLAYLEKVGIARIEEHTVGLAEHLYEGLVEQGHRFRRLPEIDRSIVTFHCSKPVADSAAQTLPGRQDRSDRARRTVRIAPALFNNNDEIEKCLAVTRQLA